MCSISIFFLTRLRFSIKCCSKKKKFISTLYRPGSRKWWRDIKLVYRRVDGTPGWQKGRKSGGSCSRQLLSWRAPISSAPEPAVTGLKMKPPDVNPGDQVIKDRRRWRQIDISQLARGWGRGTQLAWAYTVKQVVQIMKAVGETIGKVYTKAP